MRRGFAIFSLFYSVVLLGNSPPVILSHDGIFHISPSGSDTSGDGTLANPYATIQKAIGHSSESGIIYLLPGTYQGAGNRNLSISSKIIRLKSILNIIIRMCFLRA